MLENKISSFFLFSFKNILGFHYLSQKKNKQQFPFNFNSK